MELEPEVADWRTSKVFLAVRSIATNRNNGIDGRLGFLNVLLGFPTLLFVPNQIETDRQRKMGPEGRKRDTFADVDLKIRHFRFLLTPAVAFLVHPNAGKHPTFSLAPFQARARASICSGDLDDIACSCPWSAILILTTCPA